MNDASKTASYEPFSLIQALRSIQLAKLIEFNASARSRKDAMQAILQRLDEARREHAESYLADRIRRETSADLN